MPYKHEAFMDWWMNEQDQLFVSSIIVTGPSFT
jgi:hypothetical protein